MYWVAKTVTPPLNRQDVVTWNYYRPSEFRIAVWYDQGTEMDDGNRAALPGFYVRTHTGKRRMIRSGVTHFLPLEVPRDTEETKAKQFRRGYRAALLYVLSLLEDRSRSATAGEAWYIKNLHDVLERETRRIMADGFTGFIQGKDGGTVEVEVREL